MKIIRLIISIITLPLLVKAQHDPQFTLNMYNHMGVNPGYAGSHNGICATAMIREQWMGFEGAPSTQLFNFHSSFKLFGLNHGAGLSFINETAGFNENVKVNIAYAYRKAVGQGTLGQIGRASCRERVCHRV